MSAVAKCVSRDLHKTLRELATKYDVTIRVSVNEDDYGTYGSLVTVFSGPPAVNGPRIEVDYDDREERERSMRARNLKRRLAEAEKKSTKISRLLSVPCPVCGLRMEALEAFDGTSFVHRQCLPMLRGATA